MAGPNPELPIANPLLIPASDREFTWNVLVDTIDDYFYIAEEQQVQIVGDTLMEGHILSRYQPGSGIPEFLWNKDSTPGFQRWQNTFQSMRRKAEIRVVPDVEGYQVHVLVHKELEDLDRPEQSSVGKSLRRYDGGLVRPKANPLAGPASLGWIPLGRDVELEQKILKDLRGRFHNVSTPSEIELLPPVRRTPHRHRN